MIGNFSESIQSEYGSPCQMMMVPLHVRVHDNIPLSVGRYWQKWCTVEFSRLKQ